MDLNNNFLIDVYNLYTNMNVNTFVNWRMNTAFQWNGYYFDVWFRLSNDDLARIFDYGGFTFAFVSAFEPVALEFVFNANINLIANFCFFITSNIDSKSISKIKSNSLSLSNSNSNFCDKIAPFFILVIEGFRYLSPPLLAGLHCLVAFYDNIIFFYEDFIRYI
jgi:hypothetical protein